MVGRTAGIYGGWASLDRRAHELIVLSRPIAFQTASRIGRSQWEGGRAPPNQLASPLCDWLLWCAWKKARLRWLRWRGSVSERVSEWKS